MFEAYANTDWQINISNTQFHYRFWKCIAFKAFLLVGKSPDFVNKDDLHKIYIILVYQKPHVALFTRDSRPLTNMKESIFIVVAKKERIFLWGQLGSKTWTN